MRNLVNMVGCILRFDHRVFGRRPRRVETTGQLEGFVSTSSTLRKYLQTALQHRWKVLRKGRTQQRSTASNTIVQLTHNTTECTSPVHFLRIVRIFITWHFKGYKKLHTPFSGAPFCHRADAVILCCKRSVSIK